MASKLVDAVKWMRTWTYMNIKGQGHSLTLVQGHLDSNIFSLETARWIETKFHVEPPWDGRTIWPPCSYNYGKNLKKSSSLEPKGRWPWKLVCCIGYLSTTKFVQMMPLGWPWPILQWGPLCYCMGKSTMDFSETIVVYDIKDDKCSLLN